MKKLSCKETQRLLTQRSAGVADTERLGLELHLDGCADCEQYSHALSAMVRLVNSEANETLKPRQRNRAISASLAVLNAPDSSTDALAAQDFESTSRFRITWQLGAATVAVAAAAAFVLMYDADRPMQVSVQQNAQKPGIALSKADSPPKNAQKPGIALSRADLPNPALTTQSTNSRLLSGKVLVAGIALSATGEPLPSTDNVSTRAGAELALGDARVVLSKRTKIDFSGKNRRLQLRRGRVAVDVKKAAVAPKRFRVVTPRFTVVVIGTSFSVSHKQVEVYRGRVKILSPNGGVLAERLEAGSRWSLVSAGGTTTTASAKASETTPKVVDSALLLRQARAALAKRDVATARKHLSTATAQALSAPAQAEAGTLLAEAAFIEGKLGQATELYLRVAEKYRLLTAGQNALYAAARLTAKRGNKGVARKLFKRYLKRYPQGTFQAEAASNLLRLSR